MDKATKQARAEKVIDAIRHVLDNYNHGFDVEIISHRRGVDCNFSSQLMDWKMSLYIDNWHFFNDTDEYMIAHVMYQVSTWLKRPDYIEAYSKIIWAQA